MRRAVEGVADLSATTIAAATPLVRVRQMLRRCFVLRRLESYKSTRRVLMSCCYSRPGSCSTRVRASCAQLSWCFAAEKILFSLMQGQRRAPDLKTQIAALKLERIRLSHEKKLRSKALKAAEKRLRKLKKTASQLSSEDLTELLTVKAVAQAEAKAKAKAKAAAAR